MQYNFDEINDRRHEYSTKWTVGENELPMWVADMDFKTAPEITDAVIERARLGTFGYTEIPDEWKNAVVLWYKRRHGALIEPEWTIFSTGVIATISSAVRKLTTPNENVVLMTPVYNIFYNSIINNGCRVLENRLIYADGAYSIDWADLENKLADEQTSLMILCNPHNPTGNIWTKEELAEIGRLCVKYGVTVISDEIHCDLTEPGYNYTPFFTASEECRRVSATCIAPTKTFNIAGLQTSAVIVPDKFLRHKIWRALNTDEVAEPNVFAMTAAIAAYEKGEKWLEELRVYLSENRGIAQRFISEKIPQLSAVCSHATYLMWIDCSRVTDDSSEFAAALRRETGLYLSRGEVFGGNGGKFVRMNLACPKSVMLDGLERLEKFVKSQG